MRRRKATAVNRTARVAGEARARPIRSTPEEEGT